MGVRYEPFWQPVAYNFDRTNWYPDLYTGLGSEASVGIVQANHNGINGSTVHNDMKTSCRGLASPGASPING